MKVRIDLFIPRRCQLYLYILGVFLITASEVTANTTDVNSYSELELYKQTLLPENVAIYKQAYDKYINTPKKSPVYSSNTKLNKLYSDILLLPDSSAVNLNDKINAFYNLSIKARGKKCYYMEFESLFKAFMLSFWSEHPNYSKAFEYAIILEDKLGGISEQEYPDLRKIYFKLGEAYYIFNDFNKSIELLKHAITDKPPRSFTDCTNLDARKIIGICYANINQMDISDSYFISTLTSDDVVLNRPIYNAIALSHLGCNSMLKGEYQKALDLDLEVLPFLKTTDDYGHLAGMYACQCFSYFGLEEASLIANLADSVINYAHKDVYNKNKRLKQAYTILSHYNIVRGDVTKAVDYKDSLIEIYKEEAKVSNSRYIFQAKQKVSNDAIRKSREEAEEKNQVVIIISVVFILAILALVVIMLLYFRARSAYRALVKRNQEWASLNVENDVTVTESEQIESVTKQPKVPVGVDLPSEEVSKEDLALMSRVFSFVVVKRNYSSPGFNLDILSEHIGVNRKYISKAINRSTGKNFNTYINEYRVKEAIRILSDPDNKYLSVEEVGLQVGFKNRSSFYDSFRKMTGISPSKFKKTEKNM